LCLGRGCRGLCVFDGDGTEQIGYRRAGEFVLFRGDSFFQLLGRDGGDYFRQRQGNDLICLFLPFVIEHAFRQRQGDFAQRYDYPAGSQLVEKVRDSDRYSQVIGHAGSLFGEQVLRQCRQQHRGPDFRHRCRCPLSRPFLFRRGFFLADDPFDLRQLQADRFQIRKRWGGRLRFLFPGRRPPHGRRRGWGFQFQFQDFFRRGVGSDVFSRFRTGWRLFLAARKQAVQQ